MSDKKISLASLLPCDRLSVQLMKERATLLAVNEGHDTDGKIKRINYIKFMLGQRECYGIPYEDIQDIKHYDHITRVPNVPDYVMGITYWHGKLIAVIDLGKYFGLKQESALTTKPYIATLAANNSVLGFAFDNVVGVDSFQDSGLDKMITANPKIQESFIQGVHAGQTAILNVRGILTEIIAELMKSKGVQS